MTDLDLNPPMAVIVHENGAVIIMAGAQGPAGPVDPGAVQKDTTGNLTIAHTSDDNALGAIGSTLTPDVTLEHDKTGSVEESFTLIRPTNAKNGRCTLELTVDATGGYSMGTTDITIVSGAFVGDANTVNWIELVHKGTGKNARVWITQE